MTSHFEDHLPNLLTVAKHSAFSTNHLADTGKTTTKNNTNT